MIYGYARVSTAAQDESGQVKQLKPAGCGKIFREKITGTTADRPQLGKLMKRPAAGDVVITPAVDRLSRDTTDLPIIARRFSAPGQVSVPSATTARWISLSVEAAPTPVYRGCERRDQRPGLRPSAR